LPKDYKGTPYTDTRHQTGAQAIPGKVDCAFYDRGGEGIAYHDTTDKNLGSGTLNPADGTYLNEFRMREAVDISYTKFHNPIFSRSLFPQAKVSLPSTSSPVAR
jgi:hypothetical protein